MVTPVPIPNTEVKRSCGDDSPMRAKVACRQNKVFNQKTPVGCFFVCVLSVIMSVCHGHKKDD